MDTKLRSLLKAVSYRAMGSFVTAVLVLVVTNKAALAISVGLLDSAVKILAYFVHERLWAKIPYGRIDSSLSPVQASGSSAERLPALQSALSPVPLAQADWQRDQG